MSTLHAASQMLLYLTLLLIATSALSTPTPSPESAFLSPPENITVLEGEPTILKCKIKENIHTCQWFYLEKALDFFDTRFTPVPIKTFRAINGNDCSIKFSNVKMRQSGQWMCKGFKILARKYIISNPAVLDVIPRAKDNSTGEETLVNRNSKKEKTDLPNDSTPSDHSNFLVSESMEGHVINSHLGYEVLLDCQAVVPLSKCAWITPDGIKYRRKGLKPSNYNHIEIVGNMSDGNCSLLTRVKYQDEGNWRCLVTAEGELSERIGPLIHLHILELGPHTNDPAKEILDKKTGVSLVTILVTTLFVLLFVVLGLCFYIYRQKKINNHSHFSSGNSSTADYNTYGTTWLPSFGVKEQRLLNDPKLREEEDSRSNHYTRYLDMTGATAPGREGYVMFPPSSIRSSTSSRTTLSTLPAGRHSSFGNNSGHTSISESLPSMSSAEEFPFDKKPLGRELSTYSTGHLYEEIKYGKKEDCDELKKTLEDNEGYILPKTANDIHIIPKKEMSETAPKLPPFPKLNESDLSQPKSEDTNWASNPTYGLDSEKKKDDDQQQGSYDIPLDLPVPIRTDSTKGNLLANYDVPSRELTPVASTEDLNDSNA